MPKVRALTKAQQQAERNHVGNILMLEVLAAYKAREDRKDCDIIKDLNWGSSASRMTKFRKEPGQLRFNDIRNLLQLSGVTPEQWLRIGGFEVGR